MSTYFKPLRRKIGVITLVIACALAAGWMRSFSFQDTLTIGFGPALQYKLVSNSSRMIVAKLSISGKEAIRILPWTSKQIEKGTWELNFHADKWISGWSDSLSDDFYSTGADAMGVHFTRFAIRWWQFPYWSIAIPLMLLSTWLLLSNPRAKAEAAKT